MEKTPVACLEAGGDSCGCCDDSTATYIDNTHGNVGVTMFRCNGDPVRVITEGEIASPTLGAKAGQKSGECGNLRKAGVLHLRVFLKLSTR